jgi:hypothetical protein
LGLDEFKEKSNIDKNLFDEHRNFIIEKANMMFVYEKMRLFDPS